MLNEIIVNATLGVLVLLSVVTWTIAWIKVRQDQQVVRESKVFETQFFAARAWTQLTGLVQHGGCRRQCR